MRNRVHVMHGVNLDTLGRRDAAVYGDTTLSRLEMRIAEFARALGLEVTFFQTNHEGEYVEELHKAPDFSDALILNPGAWTHYAWAIHDALEVTGLPAAEVHLSAVKEREPWRRLSVIEDLCVVSVSGKLADGYRDALEGLRRELSR